MMNGWPVGFATLWWIGGALLAALAGWLFASVYNALCARR
jgi:hypothetical protein